MAPWCGCAIVYAAPLLCWGMEVMSWFCNSRQAAIHKPVGVHACSVGVWAVPLPGVALLGGRCNAHAVVSATAQVCPQGLQRSVVLWAHQRVTILFKSLPVWKWGMVPQCSFNLHFATDGKGEHLFLHKGHFTSFGGGMNCLPPPPFLFFPPLFLRFKNWS